MSESLNYRTDQPEGVLLDVKGLKKYYPIKRGILRKTFGYVKAVDGVDFMIKRGETFGWLENPVAERRRSASRY